MRISDKDSDVLKLIMRSPDKGDGWRNVSDACWPLVEGFESKELIESRLNVNGKGGAVRLTDRGAILFGYL